MLHDLTLRTEGSHTHAIIMLTFHHLPFTVRMALIANIVLLSSASLRVQKHEEQGTPSALSVKPSRTPWQTPPPAFAELATPQTAAATAGWQELCDEDPSKEGALYVHAAPSF